MPRPKIAADCVKFKFQKQMSSKRAADASAEGDAPEKKQNGETFPDTIFEEEAKRLLEEKVAKWREAKAMWDIVERVKEVLKDKDTASRIDERLVNRYFQRPTLSAVFDFACDMDKYEPTRIPTFYVADAVAERLLRVIKSREGLTKCKEYLKRQWFASTKRTKDRPSVKEIQEEARQNGLLKLTTLLGKLPALWKQFATKNRRPAEISEDSD